MMLVESIITELNGILIIKISGKIDLQSHQKLTAIFSQILSGNAKNVVLNMSEIDIISSSGVGAILRFSNDIKKVEGKLILSSMSFICQRVFDLLQLTDTFIVCESDSQALKEF